jgi:DNA-binding NarL/FixJ family response regulator
MAEAAQSVTVLAVDDQPIFLRTARSLIAATPGFEQVGEAVSGEEAIELAELLNPDLVLVDVRMPGMDGIETARRLTSRDPHPVVVLVSLEEMPEASQAADTGVAACMRKQELSTRTLQEMWRSVGRRG